MDQVTSDNASVNRAGNADRGGPACFADSADQSEFARVFSQESQTQTCTDPTATTPREEALQQSLPENERNLPPPATPDNASASLESQTQTCTDPSVPTPREKALQQSLPETERNLPPPSSAAAGAASGAAAVNPNLALATSLVKTGGSGTAEDAKLVAESLAKLPKSTLEQMQKNGTKVIACRGSVTDYRTDLKGVQPRGWPPGATWDKVPGSNTPDKNEVVIAVIGHGTPAGPHVPKTGEGHGCASLVAHEASHSIDQGSPKPSQSDDFKKARDADMDKLSDYEKQAGEAGPEETYAESAARHAEGKDADTPHLKKYWDDHP
jgi:hypothetical protein